MIKKIIIALVIIYFVVNYIHEEYPTTYETLEGNLPIVEKFINLKSKIINIDKGIDIDLDLNFNSSGDENG